MSTISFVPLHARAKELLKEFIGGIEADDELKAYTSGWLEASTARHYEGLVSTIIEKGEEENVAHLLAETAFWKAVANLYCTAGKFALADKLGWLPPRVL
jgi:hypothetical protein